MRSANTNKIILVLIGIFFVAPLLVYIGLDNFSYQYHLKHANNFICHRKYDRAVTESRKALSINPKAESGYYFLGLAYQNLGHIQQARECYEQALILNPDHALANLNLSIIYKAMGRYDESRQCREKTQRLFHPQQGNFE